MKVNKKPFGGIFGISEPCWIIVRFKSGRLVGGLFGDESDNQNQPKEGGLYLKEQWIVNESYRFLSKVHSTKGVFIPCDDIESVSLIGRDYKEKGFVNSPQFSSDIQNEWWK